MKIFLDANIFVAASGSATGASRYLWRVAEREASWQLLTSAYAIAEARRNVEQKLPRAMPEFRDLITARTLTVVHPPLAAFLKLARTTVPEKDGPILAAAIFAQADCVCTLDQKDFHRLPVKRHCARWGLKIVFPHDLLRQWRETLD